MTQGLKVFNSLHEAKVEGFELYDRSLTVFLVRKKIGDTWQLAIVKMTLEPGVTH